MTNFTGSLPHVGAMRSANPESGAYHKCGLVDSDIATYVNNRYEIDDDHKVKKAFWRRKTYTPGTLVDVSPLFSPTLGARPSFNKDGEPGIIHKPLPSVHVVETGRGVEADMGVEMKTFAASTLDFMEAGLPTDDVKPAAVRVYPVVDRI
jgi:hypothetical protein